MNNVQKLVTRLHKVEDKFGVDTRDLTMLDFLSSFWNADKVVRVMDVVRTNTIASPSTVLHIIKDLEFVGMIAIESNEEDAREKIINKGKKFAALDKFLEGV